MPNAYPLGHSSGQSSFTLCDKSYIGTGQSEATIPQDIFEFIPPADQLINGPSPICTTGIYSIDLPQGTTVTWSSNSSGLAINPTTGAATRNGRFSGEVTITASLNGACTPTNFTKLVKVGNYTSTGTSVNSNCSGNSYNVLNTSLSAACTANTPISFVYNISDLNDMLVSKIALMKMPCIPGHFQVSNN